MSYRREKILNIMVKQNNKNKVKKEKKIARKNKPGEIKNYYEAESWMFSACGD